MNWDKLVKSSTRLHVILIIAWSLMMLVPGIIQLPLLDRDEPRFSRATVEMMENKDLVIPYFNGEYRFDKPPLTYWWMSLNYTIFGKNELGARLHSVFSSVLIGVLIYFWGRKEWNVSVGLGASFGWSICLQNLMQGRLALADMPMILMLVLSHWALWIKLNQTEFKKFDKSFWVFYLSMGLGFLAKGPIAILFPVITLLFYGLVFRRPLSIARLQLLSGLCLTLLIIASWGIPALLMTEGRFWDQGMGTHVIDRGLKSFNERIIIPGFYIPTSLLSLFPVFPFIAFGFWQAIKRRSDLDCFLLGWCVGPFLVFSFYATQLIHYTLPAFPAIFLLAFCQNDQRQWKIFGRIYESIFLLLVVLLIGIWGWFTWGVKDTSSVDYLLSAKSLFAGFAIALAGTIGSLLAIWKFWRHGKNLKGMIVSIAILSCFMVFAGFHGKYWAMSPKIGSHIKLLPKEAKPIGIGYREPSIVFYSGRKWDLTKGDTWYPESDGSEITGPVVIKTFEIQIEDFLKGTFKGFDGVRGETIPDSPLQSAIRIAESNETPIIKKLVGLNFARMSYVEVVLVKNSNQLLELIQKEKNP